MISIDPIFTSSPTLQLVNTLKVQPWINVPHLATDDYVQQLATFLFV